MDIREATKKAFTENRYISREDWESPYKETRIKINPTNGTDRCIISTTEHGKEKSSRRGWQPGAEDLMADNWIVLD